METGTLSSWKVSEGSDFGAGDSLAEIETDKASIDFEAQDDGYVAKLLVDPGSEVAVGTPIMVTVEEEDYLAAFADFKLPESSSPDATAAAPEPEPETVSIPEPVVAAVAEPAPVAAPTPAPAAPVVVAAAEPVVVDTGVSPMWDPLQEISSPIGKSLANGQNLYHEMYGSTGHTPIGGVPVAE